MSINILFISYPKEHSQTELDKWKLVRVDESFRVIALGLPVPRYRGNPLDPPLRSRFQARDINQLPFKASVTNDILYRRYCWCSLVLNNCNNSLKIIYSYLENHQMSSVKHTR